MFEQMRCGVLAGFIYSTGRAGGEVDEVSGRFQWQIHCPIYADEAREFSQG